MAKRVLIFSLAYGPRFWGGAEVAVKEITDRIAPENVSFDMITLRFDATLPREEKMGNILVHRIGFARKSPDIKDLSSFPLSANKYLFPFLAFFKAAALHRKNRYDAAWAIMANYAGFAALFFKLLHPEIFYLLTLQEGDPISHIKRRVRFVYPLFKRIFTKADTVQAISNYLAAFGREMGAQNVVMIPNGADLEKFKVQSFPPKADPPPAEKFQDEKNYTDRRVMITVSRLVKKNAVADIIKALTYLPDCVHLWVLGEGTEKESLKLQVESLKLKERVHFWGFKNHDELPRYLWDADVFVRPSLSEGMGNSFIEAFAAGLPVIATPVGGIPDFLRHEETGLFCEVRNPKSIAKQAARLFADRVLREKIIANARRLALTRYNWDTIAREFEVCLPILGHRAPKSECDTPNVAHANKNMT